MSLFFKSQKVLLNEDSRAVPAIFEVGEGKIVRILNYTDITPTAATVDFGSDLILPGLVDTHAHINEPGRTDWEGFETATRAAAAGGITTVIDMPLNSIPATTSLVALKTKRESASGKCTIDYGFWGGVVPGNKSEIQKMINAGVVGFKCFLIESGVDEFKYVTRQDLEEVMPLLAENEIPLIVHAELELPLDATTVAGTKGAQPEINRTYKSYLNSRPQKWEVEAIRLMIDLCEKTKCKTHIVHLSAADALDDIREAKRKGLPFTVETCPHYLHFDAEHIVAGATHFKCAPPIREKKNQELLWEAVKDGTINFIVSDHSPCTPALKKMESGNFGEAWGGIAGLQFSFLTVVTEAKKRGISVEACNRLMSLNTAQFIGVSSQKGKLAVGCDADFFIYRAHATTEVTPQSILHKHKITPYLGAQLNGTIGPVYLRGEKINLVANAPYLEKKFKGEEIR